MGLHRFTSLQNNTFVLSLNPWTAPTLYTVKNFIITTIFVLLVTGMLPAQKKAEDNLPFFEKKLVHFGFTLGGNTTNFIMRSDITAIDSLYKLQIKAQPGFNIGIIASLRLGKLFTLRFLPTLSFAQRDFEYTFDDSPYNKTVVKSVESTYLMFPLLFKFRAARFNNFAAYLVGGFDYGLDISSQFDVDNEVAVDEQVLKVSRHNYMGEFGAGLDFFLPYFKFAIEIKLSVGVNNVFIDDGTYWATPIQQLNARMLTFSLHFEG